MNIEDEINSQTWWVLQQVKKKTVLLSQDLFYLEKTKPFEIGGQHISVAPSYATQIEILGSLQGKKAIDIYKEYRAGDLITSSLGENPEWEIRILMPKFDKIYQQYEKANARILKAQANKQEPMSLNILEMPEIKMAGSQVLPPAEKAQFSLENPLPERVEKIECLKHQSNTGKLKIVINDNYQLPLEVRLGKYWTKFYELAEKQRVSNQKGFFDYFNSNLKNPIYSKLGYKQSQILKFDGAALIIPKATVGLISNKQFIQRKNKTA